MNAVKIVIRQLSQQTLVELCINGFFVIRF